MLTLTVDDDVSDVLVSPNLVQNVDMEKLICYSIAQSQTFQVIIFDSL